MDAEHKKLFNEELARLSDVVIKAKIRHALACEREQQVYSELQAARIVRSGAADDLMNANNEFDKCLETEATMRKASP